MNKITTQYFRCTRCDVKFGAKVEQHEAGTCPKCGDTEWITRIYGWDPNNPDNEPKPYWSAD